jgi:uncharacterized protein YkwD
VRRHGNPIGRSTTGGRHRRPRESGVPRTARIAIGGLALLATALGAAVMMLPDGPLRGTGPIGAAPSMRSEPAAAEPAAGRAAPTPRDDHRGAVAPTQTASPTGTGRPSSTATTGTPTAAAPRTVPNSTAPSSTGPVGLGTPTPAPPSSGTGTGATTADSRESEVLAIVNRERAANGCGAVTVNAKLAAVARAHSVDQATHGTMSHTGSDGSSPWDRANRAGYTHAIGENVAAGYRTAEAVMTGWLNSPGHRANILNCAAKAIGIGVATADDGTPYWTQVFGSVA